ncbi:protein-methionine-sulfoxide reductase heme-binding subunit MsrQ [Thalassobius sp. S69A]|uniref:protein-methionine-sulfoxide reductase heme-binding subunit MsrQ n=1 Tax=unclassified Thalassovita TaxID=2619711 RepID=UPI000C0E0D69|nr:protein-methionine-sulfoxide reductase heme-binding subunit MsrQ [Paracoccaceae bacterium]MBT26769.1 protein-methionine-sulfoxide reductase heme-binding subunit MsrQ [Paracoccaceae bacterium]
MQQVTGMLRTVPPWLIYLGGAAWATFLFWQGATGRMGPEPIKALEHAYGEAALIALLAGLAITPLRRFLGLNLLRFRRAVGLTAFFFVVCHVLVWAVLDVQSVQRVWADILRRPYITVGMAGLALLLPLAMTSNNRALRWLGPRWRQLHRLTYPAVFLAAVHFVMLRKGLQAEPMIYLLGTCLLLALRFLKRASRGKAA